MKKISSLWSFKLTGTAHCTKTQWPADSHIPLHHHNTAQFIYAAQGTLTLEMPEHILVVPPTRAVWIPAHMNHSIYCSSALDLLTFQFAQDKLPIDTRQCRIVQVSALLRACMLKVEQFPQQYQADTAQGRLAAVLLDEINAAPITPFQLPMPKDKRAKKIAYLFLNQPDTRHPMKDWADQAGASERTLSRIFQAETAQSFGAWQQQARISKSLELLANGSNVTDTALAVGFQSSSAFIAVFNKTIGMTPAKYFTGNSPVNTEPKAPSSHYNFKWLKGFSLFK